MQAREYQANENGKSRGTSLLPASVFVSRAAGVEESSVLALRSGPRLEVLSSTRDS